VLSDSSSEAGVRQKRAKGLVAMGRAFRSLQPRSIATPACGTAWPLLRALTRRIFKSYGKANAIDRSDFTRHVEEVGRKAEQMVQEARDNEQWSSPVPWQPAWLF
jgi:hypothetical protein